MGVLRNRIFSSWRTEAKGIYCSLPLRIEKTEQTCPRVAQCEKEKVQSQAAARESPIWYEEKELFTRESGWMVSVMGVQGSTLGYIQNITGQATGSDTGSAFSERLDSMTFRGTFQPKYFFKYLSKWFLSKLVSLSKSLLWNNGMYLHI